MCSHSYFVSKYVNVLLHQRHWLSKNVETSADQVNIKYFVVFNDAEDTFVIVTSPLWTKVDYNSCR